MAYRPGTALSFCVLADGFSSRAGSPPSGDLNLQVCGYPGIYPCLN